MNKTYLDGILAKIEEVWTGVDVWPDLLAGMRSVVHGSNQYEEGDIRPRAWAPLLPGLCCEAAGGEMDWAVTVSAAWSLFHVAAHLLDGVADQDEPATGSDILPGGLLINIATGLLFSASWALDSLYKEANVSVAAADLVEKFHQNLFTITSGQQVDLLVDEPSTEVWWRVAGAKSGIPFALACWAGARLATQDPARLEGYWVYGYHLGLLVQVLDDAGDFLPQVFPNRGKELNMISPWSLPIAYAMEVLPADQRNDLRQRLSTVNEGVDEGSQILDIIESSGASLYVETYLDYHLQKALASLEKVALVGDAKNQLLQIVNRLVVPH